MREVAYRDEERARAIAWKRVTAELPEKARVAAVYPAKGRATTYEFCLPPELSALSLLPDMREPVLELFADERIQWHDGMAGGPSNHLLDSQVQCANALGRMVHSAEAVKAAFGERLGIDQVLPIEKGRFLTFEYVGEVDLLNEGPRMGRGSHRTSVDAAFLHRDHDGVVELVLVEWKYTEKYGRHKESPSDVTRERRYGELLRAPGSPVRADLLPFTCMLDEPFYQLMRQQLLAAELERTGVLGASRVRVLHVAPTRNTAYSRSLSRAEHKTHGSTVQEVWKKLLLRPDRFSHVDSAIFLDASVTSREYVARYGDVVVQDESRLLEVTGADNGSSLADQLFVYYDGVVTLLGEDGLTVAAGTETVGLSYPFSLSELFVTALELEAPFR